jgi:hypothetical protein
MGYLPIDVMDFVRKTANCAPRNNSALDYMICCMSGVEEREDLTVWQNVAAFGLLLLACGASMEPQHFAAEVRLPQGRVWRAYPLSNGTYRVQPLVGPGRLRGPIGIAVAPPAAERQGVTPGHLFINSYLPALSGKNYQEIVEFTPEGAEVRAFTGGRTFRTGLGTSHGMTFAPDGALLACHAGLGDSRSRRRPLDLYGFGRGRPYLRYELQR